MVDDLRKHTSSPAVWFGGAGVFGAIGASMWGVYSFSFALPPAAIVVLTVLAGMTLICLLAAGREYYLREGMKLASDDFEKGSPRTAEIMEQQEPTAHRRQSLATVLDTARHLTAVERLRTSEERREEVAAELMLSIGGDAAVEAPDRIATERTVTALERPPASPTTRSAVPNLHPAMPWTTYVRLDEWRRPVRDDNGVYVALMAPFRNDATKEHPIVSEADDLVATVRPASIPEFVITGYWLNSDDRRVAIEDGGRQVLVLAVVQQSQAVSHLWERCAWFLNDVRDDEQEHYALDLQQFWCSPTNVDDVTVSVTLSNRGMFVGDYRYKLTLQPVPQIALIQESG
jgi:hypothetical protein